MNTLADLRAELDALSRRAPDDADVRDALADGIRHRTRHRRTTALVSIAAAVVVVAGGAGIARAVFSQRSAQPASPVVDVPTVPLPADTKLIRHRLPEITTPVTATPPGALDGTMWMMAPGRLAVLFFTPPKHGTGAFGLAGPGTSQTPTAGYVITASRDDTVHLLGPDGLTAAPVTRTDVRVGDRDATLDTAPADATDGFGFPAGQRISWQLANGQWIHVWQSDLPARDSLTSFAAGITEQPQVLARTVGIGVTLPGLTHDSSMNSSPTVSYLGAGVYLCPSGVDPLAPTYSSSSGGSSSTASTSAPGSTPGSGSASGSESDSAPDSVAGSATAPDADGAGSDESSVDAGPNAACVTAVVANIPATERANLPVATTVTVGDTVAHVSGAKQAAWADLGDGATAVVSAPRGSHLSDADLAALVASVRLAPDATLLPMAAQTAAGESDSGVARTVVGPGASTTGTEPAPETLTSPPHPATAHGTR